MNVSVIVCTRNRAYAIAGCLDSIAASFSNASPIQAEIVVVDNASDDNTAETIKAWAAKCPFPVNLVSEPVKGLSKARNSGIKAAKGDLIIFTDDDCRLSADYITTAMRYDEADTGPVLRSGRVELGDTADLPVSIKTDKVTKRWSRALNSAKSEYIGESIIGCNMAMRRSVIERLGPFDERFGAGSSLFGGEDTDYALRAYVAGMLIEYVPDMVIYHFHGRRKNTEVYKLVKNYAVGTGALYAKYLFKSPDLCRQFYWDARKAAKELITGRNQFKPDIGFTHKAYVSYCILGAIKFLFTSPVSK